MSSPISRFFAELIMSRLSVEEWADVKLGRLAKKLQLRICLDASLSPWMNANLREIFLQEGKQFCLQSQGECSTRTSDQSLIKCQL